MRIYFLEEFQSADNAPRYNPDLVFIFTFRDITQFDIRLPHYTACVYSIEREMQTMRINFLEEFQSVLYSDNARSIALQRAYTGHSRYNLSHFYFPRYNPVRTTRDRLPFKV